MKVVILTEGGKDYGYGHVARCSSIYQAFDKYGVPVEFIINGDDSIKPILEDINFSICNWIADLSIIFKADIVIVDSYLAELDTYEYIFNNTPLVVYIDDNNRLKYPGGIIVNGTLDESNMNYPMRDDVIYLVGKDFIPLRKDFWDISKLKINEDINDILITTGGNDLRNLTPKILDLLNSQCSNINKKVIITNSFNNVPEIEFLSNDSVELIYSPDSKKMLDTMSNVDLAISSSGQTLYELACIGVPTIAIGIIDNQKNNIKSWKALGFIEYAGCWNNNDLFDNILKKIDLLKDKNIRFDKKLVGNEVIDGKGSLRIVKSILNEYYKKYSIFREINEEDCFKIFEIANDEEVRKSSFDSKEIKLDDHKTWFKNILSKDSTKFYVLEYNKDIIGQLRFDLDENYPVISISLNKKYRGLGLSKYLLNEGIDYLDTFDKIVAYIKKDNVKSISFFKSMGFELEDELIIKNCDALKFIRS